MNRIASNSERTDRPAARSKQSQSHQQLPRDPASKSTASWIEVPPYQSEVEQQLLKSKQQLLFQDPRNYKYLPAKFTQNIQPAGCKTGKSDQVGTILSHPYALVE